MSAAAFALLQTFAFGTGFANCWRRNRQKGKHAMKPKATKIRMTAAEIKEAIKRDKEWMDNIGPDDEIVVDKKTLRDIFGDDDDREEKADDVDDSEVEEDEETQVVEDDDEDDDSEDEEDDEVQVVDDDDDDDDDDVDTSGVGGMLGALVGGIGGIVIGGILGTALFDD